MSSSILLLISGPLLAHNFVSLALCINSWHKNTNTNTMAQQYFHDDETVMTDATDQSWFDTEDDDEFHVHEISENHTYAMLPYLKQKSEAVFPRRSDIYLYDSSDDEESDTEDDEDNDDECQVFKIPFHFVKNDNNEVQILNMPKFDEDYQSDAPFRKDGSSDLGISTCCTDTDSNTKPSLRVREVGGSDANNPGMTSILKLREYYKYDPVSRWPLDMEDLCEADGLWRRRLDRTGGLWVLHSVPLQDIDHWASMKAEDYQYALKLEKVKQRSKRPTASERKVEGLARKSIASQIEWLKLRERLDNPQVVE